MTSDGTRQPRRRFRPVIALVALALGACASGPPDGTRQYLDETSAATVTVAREALVFARERPELAVYARDYLTLVPVDVNRMGAHTVYFYGFVWSTIDKRRAPAHEDASSRFEIIADGRSIPLVPVEKTPRELGLGEPPVRAPSSSAHVLIARTDLETLAYIAAADSIRVVQVRNGVSERYELWSGNPGSQLALR